MRRSPSRPSAVPPIGTLIALGLGACATLGCAQASGECASDDYYGTRCRAGAFDATTLHVNNGNEPEYLDPTMAHDTASSALIHQLFEGLTTYGHGDMRPVAAGAIAYDKSDDNRYFRFHLRPNAKWSDGKPVTAHDYEYAWRRLLRPETASQAATTVYAIKNAELVNQGKLRVAKGELALLDAPRAGAPTTGSLPKGTAVRILAESPRKVLTALAPLAAPKLVPGVDFDAKSGSLAFSGEKPEGGGDGGQKGADVEVLDQGPSIECNGEPSHYFLVATPNGRGYLPGCALGKPASKDRFALVERFDEWPTYAPPEAPPPAAEAKPRGYVALEGLDVDDRLIGVRATDDLTLDVELERPTAYFLDITSATMLFPVRRDVIEAWKQRGEPEMWTRPENMISNGPYALDEHRFRYEITLKRNPHHVLHDQLRIHRVAVLEVEAYHPTMNLYRSGDLDYLGDNSSLPTEYVRFLETKKDFVRYPYNATYWYELNTKKPPLDNVLVRRALNLAMDKTSLVQNVTRGGQKAASHYVPDIMGLGYDQAAKADQAAGTDPFGDASHTFNPPRARQLLRDAGYEIREENGRFSAPSVPPIEILYNTSEAHRNLAVAIQGMWKENLGVTVTLRNEEWKVMLKNVRDGNFQVVRFGWVAEYNHAQTYMDTFLSFSPSNRTKWGTQEFDDAVRLAASTADPVESIRLYRQAELLAVDAVPKIPIYFYTKQTLIKPWVRGFRTNPKNLQLFKWLWLEPGRTTMPEGPEAPAFADEELPPPGRIAPAPVKGGPP